MRWGVSLFWTPTRRKKLEFSENALSFTFKGTLSTFDYIFFANYGENCARVLCLTAVKAVYGCEIPKPVQDTSEPDVGTPFTLDKLVDVWSYVYQDSFMDGWMETLFIHRCFIK